MKDVFKHMRIFIFRGLFAIIPLLLSVLAIKVLYELIDKRVTGMVGEFVDVRLLPGLGILLVLVCLYIIGLVVSNVMGRQIFYMIESISERIPVIKAIYQVGKQLSESLAVTGDKKAFQKALLVDCNNSGLWTVGLVTGKIIDQKSGEEFIKVFIPTVPNPTTGFVFVVKPSQTIDPGWSVEEGIKMVVSAGIISPPQILKGKV